MKREPLVERRERALLGSATVSILGLALSAMGHADLGRVLALVGLVAFGANLHWFGRTGVDEG